ncbi:MAG: UDP-3-O-(3-hydroxymyristoyl)glucosamine N-acyltransferase [Proteobacteria bacterium]|nr:UDP-3-O-(3-hydroxymyristoyl)glucosamine N-acyltransferase [Pseudomonadota bacterium]
MADPRFFRAAGPFTLRQLAAVAGADMLPGGVPDALFHDVAPLDKAGPRDVSFLDNRRYADAFAATRAGACLASPAMAARAPSSTLLLVTTDPYRGYAKIARAFYPASAASPMFSPLAIVAPDAVLGENVRIDPGAAVGSRAEIGAGARIHSNAVIGEGVVIGAGCEIGPGASISHTLMGARVIVHGGARLGQDGFGFAMGAAGHEKVPQLGRVIVGDDVEIGANTTIDRGAGPDTEIGSGTKIDNLVQIGHNVQIGRCCVIVAQVGISGSTRIGDFVVIGGQAGITGHLTIGAGAKIGGQSGVIRDVPEGQVVMGTPALLQREYWRQLATLAQMADKSRKGGGGRGHG